MHFTNLEIFLFIILVLELINAGMREKQLSDFQDERYRWHFEKRDLEIELSKLKTQDKGELS